MQNGIIPCVMLCWRYRGKSTRGGHARTLPTVTNYYCGEPYSRPVIPGKSTSFGFSLMTRPLSPDSARIAHDLIDQHYGADHIAGTLNNMRRQEGQNTLPAYGPAYAGWARTHHPLDPTPYSAQEVREFRRSRPSASMPPALAGLPPRPSNLSRPARSAYTQAPDLSPQHRAMASEMPYLGSNFIPSQWQAASIEQHNQPNFSGGPLPSGDSVLSQSSTSDPESRYFESPRVSS